MLLQDPNLKVWLYTHSCDMRNQYNGLAALVQSKTDRRACSGELFVFINRKRTQMKILYYSHGGYCLWSKRLERGHFQTLACDHDSQALSWAQLQCLIDGIVLPNKPSLTRRN